MRNRAKCCLCNSIIESFANIDYVECQCGEIAIDGGLKEYKALAKNWSNFLRIDDEGNEIVVTVKDDKLSQEIKESTPNQEKISKKELLSMLEEMIKQYDNLPSHAMTSPITHSDLYSVLILVSALFRSD